MVMNECQGRLCSVVIDGFGRHAFCVCSLGHSNRAMIYECQRCLCGSNVAICIIKKVNERYLLVRHRFGMTNITALPLREIQNMIAIIHAGFYVK